MHVPEYLAEGVDWVHHIIWKLHNAPYCVYPILHLVTFSLCLNLFYGSSLGKADAAFYKEAEDLGCDW